MAMRRGVEAGLTMRQLLEIPQIANTLVAGASGLDRPVVWAHACEMPQPWEWVGPDELLMSIGHCVPAGAQAQAKFIASLAAAGLAGVAIGDDPPAPRVSKAMRAEADARAIPLLIVNRYTPFSIIARTVATANEHAELQRLWRMSRLNLAIGSSPRTSRGLLSRVADELGQNVHVVDARYGTEIWPAETALAEPVRRALTQQLSDQLDRLPARTRVELDDWSGTCFPLPCNRPAVLVVPDHPDRRIDPFAVVHLATLMAGELKRLTAQRDQHRRDARHLFGQLLTSRLDSDSATRQLRRFGLKRRPLTVVALAAEDPDVSDELMDRRLPHLASAEPEASLLLVEAAQLSLVLSILGPGIAVGTSAELHALPHLPDAAREARWALHTAIRAGGGHAEYGSAHPLFLPRTVTEAQNAARSVLGPILDYDQTTGSELVASLHAYLANDRSWNRAAAALGIHRQTLGARLAKIEHLTGRTLTTSNDIAECWLALQALQIL